MNKESLLDLVRDDRAVSPVIGVILMVAITVILAAVIGTFVLGLGENVQQSPRAGVSFDKSGTVGQGDATVTITYVSEGNIDPTTFDIQAPSCAAGVTNDITGVGQTSDVKIGDSSGCDGGETITVTGKVSGTSGVIGQYTI